MLELDITLCYLECLKHTNDYLPSYITLFSPALPVGNNFSPFFLFLIIHIAESNSAIAITRKKITPVTAAIVVVMMLESGFNNSATYSDILCHYMYANPDTVPLVIPGIVEELSK